MSVEKMRDKQMTKAELLQQVETLHKRLAELSQTEQALRESEQKWRSLLKDTPDIIMIVDSEGTLQFINHTVPGIKEQEATGKRVYDYISPEHHNTMRKDLKQVFNTGQSSSHDICGVGPHGSLSWYQAELGPIRQDGRIVAASIVTRDITERKRAEEARKKSEEKYRLLFEDTGTDNNVISVNGVYLMMNEKGAKRLGGRPENFVGKSVYDTFPKDAADEYVRRFRHAAESGETKTYEDFVELPTGNCWFLTNMWPVKDPDGNITSVQLISQDITERKKAEDALRESEERYKALFRGAAEGIIVADLETMKFEYVNPAICKMLGYTEEELIRLGVCDIHPKENLEYLISEFKANGRGEKISLSGSPCLRKDGTIIYANINTAKALINGKECNVGFFTDITDSKEVVETLRESEERYRILVENQTDMIVKFDKDRTLLFASPSYCKTFGKSKDELIGKKFMPLIHREDRKRVAEILDIVYKPPYTAYVEERVLTKDGWRWQAWLNTAILNNEKKVEAVIGVGRDITEQKLAEKKLQESENKYRTLLENLPQKIFLKDRNSVYLSCNENLARDFKIKPEEIVGKRDSDFFPRKLAQKYRLDDKQIVESGFTKEIDETYIEDGQERIVHTVKTPVKDVWGKVTGILGIFWDVTELRQAEEELGMYRERMAHAEQLASLGTLSATLAHELNQPLTAISLSIENSLADLKTISCPGSVIEELEDGLSAVSDVTSKVNVLRDFARKSSDEIISEVNLKEVAERILKLLRENARRARISLHLRGLDQLPPVYTNEKDMEQLFFALTENAIQAADGKKERRLVIIGGVKDEHIELRFADDCCGIAPENLDKIFEPFFTTGPEGTRTGLGLCIVERIVSEAGSKIRVESKVGKGTTFFVTLPVKKGKMS